MYTPDCEKYEQMDTTYDDDIDLNKLERDFNKLSNTIDNSTTNSASTLPSTSFSIKSPSNTGVKDINRVGFSKYTYEVRPSIFVYGSIFPLNFII